MIKRLESGPRMSQAVAHGNTVEARLAAPQYKVEIQVIAAV